MGVCVFCLSCVSGAMEDPASSAALPVGGGAGGGTAGAGGAAATAGTAQTAGGTSSSGAGQVSGGTGSGGAVSCSSFADVAAWKLTVHIKNQRTTPVYLGQMTGCGGGRLFDVIDGGRTPLPAVDSCHSSCTTVMTSGPVVCPTVCASPSTVTLAPGQTLDIPWDGLFSVPSTVPAECMHTAAPSATACVRAQQIKNGIYTFSAQAGAKLECLTTSACTCTPNPSGGCTTAGSTMAGTIITTDFIIALDPAGNGVGTASEYIGLVFKD